MKQPIIPEAALEQHVAVLGKTGSGKTYTVKAVMAEPLLEQRRTVGVIDPTGVWWGIRSSADGKGAGFKVLVLGGDHGDLPLPALGGAAVARLLAEQRVSLIADTSQLTVGERTRWMFDFASALYRANRQPLYLFLDEAHMFAPQGKIPDPDTGKMLHAVNTLASGGRARGIRLTMLTQRPAKLHKDTLTCADTLIAMRALAPHDRQAVKDWIDGCGDAEKGREVLDSLAGLQRGEGWVWYPEGGHLIRAKFPRIRTFDSSATPTHGETLPAPKKAAEIDLTEIRSALADAVKEAEENDPKRLRARIIELERAAKGAKVPVTVEKFDHGALAAEYNRGRADGIAAARAKAAEELRTAAKAISENNAIVARGSTGLASAQLRLYAAIDAWEAAPQGKDRPEGLQGRNGPEGDSAKRNGAPAASAAGSSEVGNGGLRRMMIALAQRPAGLTRRSLGVRAGLSSQSGTFATYLGKGRGAGWITEGDPIRITPDGIKALGSYEPLPTGSALLSYWLGELGNSGAARLLRALADAYPSGMTRDEAGRAADLSPASGTFATYLGKLRSLELVSASGDLRASEELFDGR